MSKRLIRIASKNIAAGLSNLTGITLNAVLQSGNTYSGVLTAVNSQHVSILDTRNHLHQLAIQDIYEVVYDFRDKHE
jgi:hypothetical protein